MSAPNTCVKFMFYFTNYKTGEEKFYNTGHRDRCRYDDVRQNGTDENLF